MTDIQRLRLIVRPARQVVVFRVAGKQGPRGPQGPKGDTGPNSITTATATDLTGFLYGNGASVGVKQIAASDLPASVTTYPATFSISGKPAAGQYFGSFGFAAAVTFPAAFSGSFGKVITANPTATYTMTAEFYRAGGVAASGTVQISTGGVFTFALAAPFTTQAGDELRVTGPAADATLDTFFFTLVGAAA